MGRQIPHRQSAEIGVGLSSEQVLFSLLFALLKKLDETLFEVFCAYDNRWFTFYEDSCRRYDDEFALLDFFFPYTKRFFFNINDFKSEFVRDGLDERLGDSFGIRAVRAPFRTEDINFILFLEPL